MRQKQACYKKLQNFEKNTIHSILAKNLTKKHEFHGGKFKRLYIFLPLQLDCKIWRDRSLGYLIIIVVIIKWNQVFVTTMSPILFFKKKFLKTYFILLIKKILFFKKKFLKTYFVLLIKTSEATVYYILARKFEIFFHNRAMLVHILLSITQWLKCNFVSLDLLLIKVAT